jgi:hypothetical protein
VAKKPAQPKRWLSAGQTGRLWHLRPDQRNLWKIARDTGVECIARGGQVHGTGGFSASRYFFYADDVYRVAPDVVEGRIEVDPTWRTDTPEGRKIYRWDRFKAVAGFIGCLSPVILVVGVSLLIGALR